MQYYLYDNGWVLEYIEKQESNYDVFSVPDFESIEKEYKAKYINCECISTSVDGEFAQAVFKVKDKETDYLAFEKEVYVTYQFTLENKWNVKKADEKVLSHSFENFEGSWQCANKDINMSLKINVLELNAEENSAVLNYKFSFTKDGENFIFESKGNETFNLKEYNYNTTYRYKYLDIKRDNVSSLHADVARIWFCADERNFVDAGSGIGIAVNVESKYIEGGYQEIYWLTKK